LPLAAGEFFSSTTMSPYWKAVEAILREGNHVVRTAVSFPEAQRLLGEQEFDAVVADAEVRAALGERALQEWLTANRPALAGG